jgi:hypothetical protein
MTRDLPSQKPLSRAITLPAILEYGRTHKEYRVKKAIQRTVDLASPLLERCWRSPLGGKSNLNLPTELMLLIEHELSDNELYNLCRANRELYHILSGRLRQRGMQDLRAFERSLRKK